VDISVDRETCIGSAQCIRLAEGVFELGDDGVVVVADPAAATAEAIVEAVEACPTRSIRIPSEADREEGADGRR
jgi:ferredoxin